MLEEILGKFEQVKKLGSNGSTRYQACCPCHEDKEPSLSITQKDGKWLMHCHAGCRNDDILKAIGLAWSDLGENLLKEEVIEKKKTYTKWNIERKAYKVYEYLDKDNEPYILVSRSRKKDFFQYSYAGDKRWIPGLNGKQPVLYHLPELIQAVANEETIYIVEGEKDADNLITLGLTATTSPMGAGKWKPVYNQYLKNANVVIIPDNDLPGKKHAEDIVSNLSAIAKEVKIIELPGLQEKQDVSDWLESGGTKEKLLELVNNTPPYVVKAQETKPLPSSTTKKFNKLETFSALELGERVLPEIQYTVEGIIPEGLTILAGRPKTGKSFLSLNLAVSVANGDVALNKIPTAKSDVLYISLEDGEKRLQKRLQDMMKEKGFPGNLNISLNMNSLDETGYEALEDYIKQNSTTKFIIIDTFAKIKGRGKKRSNSYEEDYEITGKLQKLAIDNNISILLIHHLRKSTSMLDYIEDISGSMGITGACDTIMILDRSRNEDEAVLKITGRDIEEQELALKFNKGNCTWELLGNAELYNQSKERRQIIELLQADQPMKVKDVAELLGKNYSNIKKMMWLMEKEGIIVHLGRMGYVLSFNYSNLSNLSDPGNLSNPGNLTGNVTSSGGSSTCYTDNCNLTMVGNTPVFQPSVNTQDTKVTRVTEVSSLPNHFINIDEVMTNSFLTADMFNPILNSTTIEQKLLYLENRKRELENSMSYIIETQTNVDMESLINEHNVICDALDRIKAIFNQLEGCFQK